MSLTDEQKRFLALPLDEVDLSVRTRNCLIGYLNLKYVHQVACLTASELLSTPNLGKKCLGEINALLAEAHLKLGCVAAGAHSWEEVGCMDHSPTEVLKEPQERFTRSQRAFLIQPLKSFHFSKRVAKFIIRLRLKRVGDLATTELRVIRAAGKLGIRSIEEIQRFLGKEELALESQIPEWSDSLVREWEEDLPLERKRFQQLQAIDPHQSSGGSIAFLEDELHRFVAMAALGQGERNNKIVTRFYGWDGSGRKTLEEVGTEFGMTRERVRQIVSRFAGRLRGKEINLPFLMKARTLLEEHLPTISDAIVRLLYEHKISAKLFDLTGVISALEVTGKETTICVRRVDGRQLVGYSKELDQLEKLPSVVRALVSAFGCAHLDRVALELDTKLDESCLRRFVQTCDGLRWLDQERHWFTADEAKRNRLANVVRKVLSVSPVISVSELRRGIKRVHRLQGFAPATGILLAFCDGLPFCRIQADRVVATENARLEECLGVTERCFYDVLSEFGPAMRFKDLYLECVRRGMNENTFFQYLSYSPIIYRVDHEVYSIIGAEISPGVVEQLRRKQRHVPVFVDSGWTSKGRPWIAYRLNVANIRSGTFSVPSAHSSASLGAAMSLMKRALEQVTSSPLRMGERQDCGACCRCAAPKKETFSELLST
jgi:hypothetical protein